MMNSTVSAIPQYAPQQATTQGVAAIDNTQTDEQQKTYANEQSMAITYDIAAEYNAICKMNNMLSDITKEIKTTEDPERKKLLEARVRTLNNMILQREAKINQMEQVKNQIDAQFANLN